MEREKAAATAKEEKLQAMEQVKRELMDGIRSDVHVVDEPEEAQRVCKLLMEKYKGRVFACDTEVCFQLAGVVIWTSSGSVWGVFWYRMQPR